MKQRRSGVCAQCCLAYLMGSGFYSILEVAWRGYTHWTMTLTGGFCALLLWWISAAKLPFPLRCLLAAASVTATELAVGCIVNLALRWEVWDYSVLRFSLWGQICLRYSLLWLLLSVPLLPLFRALRRLFFQSPLTNPSVCDTLKMSQMRHTEEL